MEKKSGQKLTPGRTLQICACLCTSFVTVATALGNGRHCLFVSPRNQGLVILWTIIAWWFGVLCFSLPKLAVVSLLCRLLNPSRYHRWLLWGMAIFNIVNLFVVMMLIIFRCSPIQAQWDFSRTGTCMPSSVSTGYSLYTACKQSHILLERLQTTSS